MISRTLKQPLWIVKLLLVRPCGSVVAFQATVSADDKSEAIRLAYGETETTLTVIKAEVCRATVNFDW